jgi:hypothetical protein
MRGSSDLESVWESRLTFARDGDNGIVTVTATHREEEDGFALSYRLDSHRETRTLRLRSAVPPLAERIIDHLREHGPMGVEELAKGIETRSSDVRQTLARLEALGTTHRAPSGKRDGLGRVISAKVWHLSNQARLRPVPEPGRHGTAHTDSVLPPAPRPVPLGTDGGRGTDPDALRDPVDAPQPRLRPGAPGFLHELSLAREAGHVSEGEWEQLSWLHRRAKRAT